MAGPGLPTLAVHLNMNLHRDHWEKWANTNSWALTPELLGQ